MAKINKLSLNGVTYNIEDADAQSQLTQLTNDVNQEVSNRQSAISGVEGKISDEATRAAAAEKANTDAITKEQTARQVAIENETTSRQNAYKTLQENIDKKQNKLTFGKGLELASDGKTLNVTIDTTLYKIVTELPTAPATGDENKIHLIKKSDVAQNEYIEYIWKGDAWEQLGDIQTKTELTGYVTDTELTTKLNDYIKTTDADTKYQAAGNYALKSDIPTDYATTTQLATKANSADVYSKSEIDTMVGNKVTANVAENTLNLTIA